MFGGEYGSHNENVLEETLDQQEELRNRIVEANFKWRQAQTMVTFALHQLREVVNQWKMIQDTLGENLEERQCSRNKSPNLIMYIH